MAAGGRTTRGAGGPDAACLAAGLRRFVVERLELFACSEERHDPKTTARAIGDLTRCLRELVALERALGARGGASGENDDDDGREGGFEGDAAALVAGAPPRLADLVAGEVERLHAPERPREDLDGL
ncbi:hypothetical protein [Salinarimonas rosea]|uniref:hypothetical protein n=1 Tax=Salinarimonas rosea TaxID=552063 RepID=UPI000413D4EF|nr:hypothetical protein [Salinarimonas rosea]